MESKYYFDFNLQKLFVFFLVSLFFLISCSSSQEVTDQTASSEERPDILQERQQQQPADTSNQQIELSYNNSTTNISIPLDPNKQEFVLELQGIKEEEPEQPADSVLLQDSLVQAEMAKNIKQVLKDFRRAQDLFYREDYEGAMKMVDRSLETQQTADALGLKGTIFFMMDNLSSARYYWNQAVRMDSEIPMPDIPELESIIEEIKVSEDQEEGIE